MHDSSSRQPVKPVTLLGVDYWHTTTADGGDLYLTRFGRPYSDLLQPENWREDTWFAAHRRRLEGTSVVYRVPTRTVRGRQLDLVIKWCRIGEEIPGDTLSFQKFAEAEFNGPYEEFALLKEMRRAPGPPLRTNRPLGIYVPAQRLKLWQTGRSRAKIDSHLAKFRDIELDMYRQYILIYQWVDGLSAVAALERAVPDPTERRRELAALTRRTEADLAARGFHVIDHKPVHVILRPRRDGSLLRDPDTGQYAYALVDFELLDRTPEREARVQAARRADYLRSMRDRFIPPADGHFSPHLQPTRVLGIDYVYGPADSTHGKLWVVGRNPHLFDFFLPERWRRTPKRKLSETNETFFTHTKDNVKLVWKVSRVGEQPAGPMAGHGYNSPFEEFAFALELATKGIPCTYPRAIYRCGLDAGRPDDYTPDHRRYATHRALQTPDNEPLLGPEHNYLTVWGFWNGTDESLAELDRPSCEGINLVQAERDSHITARERDDLLADIVARTAKAGFRFEELKPTHFILSLRPDRTLIRRNDGLPSLRIANFESIHRL